MAYTYDRKKLRRLVAAGDTGNAQALAIPAEMHERNLSQQRLLMRVYRPGEGLVGIPLEDLRRWEPAALAKAGTSMHDVLNAIEGAEELREFRAQAEAARLVATARAALAIRLSAWARDNLVQWV